MRASLYVVLALVAALGLASFALGQEIPPPEKLTAPERCALDGLNARSAQFELHRRALSAEAAALNSDIAAVTSWIHAAHLAPVTVASVGSR